MIKESNKLLPITVRISTKLKEKWKEELEQCIKLLMT